MASNAKADTPDQDTLCWVSKRKRRPHFSRRDHDPNLFLGNPRKELRDGQTSKNPRFEPDSVAVGCGALLSDLVFRGLRLGLCAKRRLK